MWWLRDTDKLCNLDISQPWQTIAICDCLCISWWCLLAFLCSCCYVIYLAMESNSNKLLCKLAIHDSIVALLQSKLVPLLCPLRVWISSQYSGSLLSACMHNDSNSNHDVADAECGWPPTLVWPWNSADANFFIAIFSAIRDIISMLFVFWVICGCRRLPDLLLEAVVWATATCKHSPLPLRKAIRSNHNQDLLFTLWVSEWGSLLLFLLFVVVRIW